MRGRRGRDTVKGRSLQTEGSLEHLLGEDNVLLPLTLCTHLGDEVQQKVHEGRAQGQVKGPESRAVLSRPCAGIADGG